jgi:enamine deaminase RidA (YjgF/YER057c/UK114 family)
MKRIAILLTLTFLALCLAAMLVGCGGGDNEADKARARELMLEGDAWIEKAEAEYETIATAMEEMGGARTSDDDADVDESELESLREEIESASENMEEPLQEARTVFQAIVSLNDVVDYEEYANVMLELIDEYEQVISRQGTMQQGMPEMPEDWTPPTDGSPPEDMMPPGEGAPPEGMTPPDGSDGGMQRGGSMMGSRIEELKAEAEAIRSEKDL